MGPQSADFRDTLHQHGRRLTASRRVLWDIIRAQAGHLDADELHRLAQLRDPRISLSTVYRTLNMLNELGLVDQLHLGEDHHHYEVKPDTEHYHLICSSCGQVIELTGSISETPIAAAAREHDFWITGIQIDIVGVCASCRSKEAAGR